MWDFKTFLSTLCFSAQGGVFEYVSILPIKKKKKVKTRFELRTVLSNNTHKLPVQKLKLSGKSKFGHLTIILALAISPSRPRPKKILTSNIIVEIR